MDRKLVGAIIVAVLVIGAIAGCVEEPVSEVTPTPEATPTPTPEVMPPGVTPTPTTPPALAAIGCMCHETEAPELAPHVEGEKTCMGSAIGPCHTSEKYGGPDANVHTIHPAEVGCVACHGKIPTIPLEGSGGTTCEMCHGMPNPIEPSEGRLVEIHLERGRDCETCHTGGISKVHAGAMKK